MLIVFSVQRFGDTCCHQVLILDGHPYQDCESFHWKILIILQGAAGPNLN